MRSTCRACQSPNLELLLQLGPLPLAGGFLKSKDDIKQEKFYPLNLHICAECGLVQNLDVIPPAVLFSDYHFSTSTIPALVTHFKNYAKWIKDTYNPQKVLEFGCNDGALLVELQKLGIDAFGIDISKNITTMAREKGLNVETGYFNVRTAENLLHSVGRVDFITGSNCFPHNDDMDTILEGARLLLNKNGFFSVEVMYAGDLLDSLQWDSLYHEHLNFLCVSTAKKLFERNGFYVKKIVHLDMHAGSLRIVASPDRDLPADPSVYQFLEKEEISGLTSLKRWHKFAVDVKRSIQITADSLGWLAKSVQIAGFGASGRAAMWLNACKIDYLTCMIDESPLRAGYLMPGVHTPIVYPDILRHMEPEYIFVPAWNYLEIIKSRFQNYKGYWIQPLPQLILS